eukprot:237104-Hanusia_phi.AAC.1
MTRTYGNRIRLAKLNPAGCQAGPECHGHRGPRCLTVRPAESAGGSEPDSQSQPGPPGSHGAAGHPARRPRPAGPPYSPPGRAHPIAGV